MRKSCRWLGCAALLCFTAVELSGCTSKPLISGFKMPGRKDKEAAVAKKDKKPTAQETDDLLARARNYEKAGDFPNAARMYREYLNIGGEPLDSSRGAPERSVAKAGSKSPEKNASVEKTDTPSAIQPASKAKRPSSELSKSTPKSEIVEDPWAQESHAQPEVTEATAEKLSATKTVAKNPKRTLLDEESSPSEKPAWAAPDPEAEVEVTERNLASNDRRPPARGLSEEDLEDLLDLDEGEIDWGDQPTVPQTAAAEVPAETTEASDESPASELPLVDLSGEDASGMLPPVLEEGAEFAAEEPGDTSWLPHESSEEPQTELASIEESEANLPNDVETSTPQFAEGRKESEPARPQSLALTCKDCDPWLYAQIVKLDSPDADVRKDGLSQLADMGRTARQAGLAVRTLLRDADPLVQAHAAWALWVIENDPWDSVATLRPLLDHSNSDVVELASYMLGDIGANAESASEALELLRDYSDGMTRVYAAEALIRIRGVDGKSLAVLTSSLKSKDAKQRWIAAVALGRCQGDNSATAVSALTEALKDVDPEVRSAAALSLGGLGQSAVKAVPELERVARTDDAKVRESARAALACMRR